MQIFAKTDIGLQRENNQDCFEYGFFSDNALWVVVCDGMGGVSGGQVASELCAGKVRDALKRGYREKMTVSSAKNLLSSAINAANTLVFEESLKSTELKGMGTTVVAAVVMGNIAVIAHVGDSRAYLINKKDIKFVTKDHSFVQMLIDNGRLSEEAAKTHPDRNVITRAIGVEGFVDVETDVWDLVKNDKILICTDGLNGCVENRDIVKILKKHGDSSAEKLVDAANNAGGHDNVTVVVIDADIQEE